MNLESIQVFLVVVEAGNISSAAQILYTSQSNISRRISQLEEEVGVPLLLRSKGQQNIELTQYGRKFHEYAKQIDTLTKDIESIRLKPERKFLSIGCVDTFNVATFVPFYKEFMKRHPEICPSFHTYHSTEIYSRLDSHMLDLGYVITARQRPNINVTLLYREPYVIITNATEGFYDGMSLNELKPEKEIFLRWNEAYDQFHEGIFPDKQYRLRVSTEFMVFNFLDEPGSWALMPLSTAYGKQKEKGYQIYQPRDSMDSHKCFELEHKHSRISRQPEIEIFKKEFHEYIQQNIETMLNLCNLPSMDE